METINYGVKNQSNMDTKKREYFRMFYNVSGCNKR